MVIEQKRPSVRMIGGLLSVGALIGSPGPAMADTSLSIGSNGVQYQINYELFQAPDSSRGIDPRLQNTAWWGRQQAAESTAALLQTPLGAAYAYRPLFVSGTWDLCYWESAASGSRCIGRTVDLLILNYQAVPTSTNPNVSGAALSILANSSGPQQPVATGLGQGVAGYVISGQGGQPTVVGATSNADFNGVLAAVNALPSQAAVNQSFQQVIAEPYASQVSIGLETLERFRQDALELALSTQKVSFGSGAGTCPPRPPEDERADQPAASGPSAPSPACTGREGHRWALLLDASNSKASLRGTGGLASLDYQIFQSTYGLEYRLSPDWRLGGVFGYGTSGLSNYQFSNVTIDADTYSGAMYSLYTPGPSWKIAALAGYSSFQNRSNRPIQFGTIDRTAQARWSGHGFNLALTSEYDWVLNPTRPATGDNPPAPQRDALRLKPRALVSYAKYSQGAINETGANSLNLTVNSHTADSLVLGLGGTLEVPIRLSNQSRLIPRLSIGYEYDVMGNADEEHQLTASFAQVPEPGSLTLLGQNRGASALDVGLNVEYEASESLSLYADVGGSFWSNGNEISYGGGLRWRFGGAPGGGGTAAP
ncbi:autotransporter outer membrane beta-barrel domain-containing protein [Synechococcus sp. CS-1332]|uniref:autotransporter outer membrane beta-barrel domain-containing protein n=1 Tax=Synechococcus sp. CS-1332 TaxID=2847972 RepID=UPI00223B2B2C|nr:autotransporter outer membrane beta-barrel domain-containing protein [Synechococcus sp. CS-1332]MCT0208189.1 autotransporter outer membrane beta-barrel domain-containing protein [Synechococcus sp. CS-1332]